MKFTLKTKQNKKRVKYLRQEDFEFKANLNCITRACHEILNKNKLSWGSVSLKWQPLSMKVPTRCPHANTELHAGAYIIHFLSGQLSHHAFACTCVWWVMGGGGGKSLLWSSKSLSHFRLLAGKKSYSPGSLVRLLKIQPALAVNTTLATFGVTESPRSDPSVLGSSLWG